MRGQKQLVINCVFNDTNNLRKFEEIFENFKRKIKEISIGNIEDDSSLAICVKKDNDAIFEIK